MRQNKYGFIRPHLSYLMFLFPLIDTALIVLSLLLSCKIFQIRWMFQYDLPVSFSILFYYFLSDINGLYRTFRGSSLHYEAIKIGTSWLGVVLLLITVGFFTQRIIYYDRQVIITWFLLTPLVISSVHLLLRFFLRILRIHGYNTRNVAIAGVNGVALKIKETIDLHPWMGMIFHGFYDDRNIDRLKKEVNQNVEVEGNFSQLIKKAKKNELDCIYISLSLAGQTRIQNLLYRLADSTCSVYLIPDFMAYNILHGRWSNIGDTSVISIYETPFSGIEGTIKRIEDILLGSAIFLLSIIPMIIIAIMIKITSKGPAFFVQRRYGLDGREMKIIKFRTMKVCEDGQKIVQAKKVDRRVTRLGNFLRRSSLDELPQFINVLLGNMSIVGPRPHAVSHNETFRKKIHGYMLRHKVKPGITGWAQINGLRGYINNDNQLEKRIEYDLWYIRNWSVWLDLKIIFKTVFILLKDKNAW